MLINEISAFLFMRTKGLFLLIDEKYEKFTKNNCKMAEKFLNDAGIAFEKVYADQNPARTSTNFYIEHDQPDETITVGISIYNINGMLVWNTQKSGVSNMFKSFPITWNLCDMAGRRVNRGIYLYKVSISTDGVQYESESKKIAVGSAH